MAIEHVEQYNRTLARKACLARLEPRIEAKSAELHRLRNQHGKSAKAASELRIMRSRELFLSCGGDPFMRVYS